MMKVFVDVGDVNWRELSGQKDTLVFIRRVYQSGSSIDEDLSGIIHLLDYIQDEAAKTLGEETVFPELMGDSNG